MKVQRCLWLLRCLGALALVGGPAPAEREQAAFDFTERSLESAGSTVCADGAPVLLLAPEAEGWAATAKPLPVPPRIRVLPKGLEHSLVVPVPPTEPYPRTGVGAFHPYPECEVVGMPFAGVKMCQ